LRVADDDELGLDDERIVDATRDVDICGIELHEAIDREFDELELLVGPTGPAYGEIAYLRPFVAKRQSLHLH
jgi:hypothetical protein